MIGGRKVCSPIEVSAKASSPSKVAGSNSSGLLTVASIWASASWSGPNRRLARGVGTMT